MGSVSSRLIFCSLLVAGIVRNCSGQPEPPKASLTISVDELDIRDFPEIVARLSIVDTSGRAVRDLKRKNLTFLEDAVEIDARRFELDQTPLVVMVALDLSGSMTEALTDLKRAAARFFRMLEPQDSAGLLVFSEKPRVLVPLTTDHHKLVTALWPLKSYGPTALYDAIHSSCQHLRGAKGRKVLILLTDGQDQNAQGTGRQSLKSMDEALQAAKVNEVVIHLIGLGPRINRGELERIAGTSGGAYLTPRSQDLEDMYVKIAQTLKNRLLISYSTPNLRVDGSWRAFEAKVAARGHYGAGSARYRAPGRYVLEIPGQGFNCLRPEQAETPKPALLLRDVRLKPLMSGSREVLDRWLDSYYEEPSGLPVEAGRPDSLTGEP